MPRPSHRLPPRGGDDGTGICAARIYPNVKLGFDCMIEDFAIIGAPPRGYEAGDLPTIIGDYAVIRSHTVIYAGNTIGHNFQTGNKANIRELNNIGNDVSIGTLSVIEHHIKIGNGVRIHTQVFIPEHTILEHASWVGPNVVLTNARYPKSIHVKEQITGCYIETHAILGANCTLLPGTRIGQWAIVGAGSVVTKDVSPKTVVAGNPARIINTIENLPYSITGLP